MREKIAIAEFNKILDHSFPSMAGIPFEQLPNDWWAKELAYDRADKILNSVIECIEGVENPWDLELEYHQRLGFFTAIKAIVNQVRGK